MKRFLLLFVLICLTFTFANCEKDDLCDAATPTTSRLVIEFFYETDPTIPKNLTNLTVFAEGRTDSIGYYNGTNIIRLPLQTTQTSTTYKFVLNSTIANAVNTDFLTVNYTLDNVFVSRACGYKSVFNLNPVGAIERTDTTPEDGIWMKSILVTNRTILSENETHIKVYF